MRMRRIPVPLVAGMVAILPVKAGRASCTAFVGLHSLHAASACQGDDVPRKGISGRARLHRKFESPLAAWVRLAVSGDDCARDVHRR